MDFKDYYQTLGLSKTATAKEIKSTYRKLARKHHPDVNPGDKAAEAKFKEINEAYEVLGDPDKRKKYDELGANWRMYEQGGTPGGAGFDHGGWSVNMGGGGPGGFRTMSEDEMREMFGTENPFSDFFNTFFGGADPGEGRRPRGGRGRSRKGRDLEHEITLSLEDADQGVTRRLALKHDGHARTVDVRIPAGVGDGSRVRVAGEGETGAGGGMAGDLYLRIQLAPHAVFERKGRDLYTRVAVPLTVAVLGGEVDVPALGGRTLRLKVPGGTQSGQVFRLRGQGMALAGKVGERSDLYATVEVQLPRQLTSEQRDHFEALAKIGV